MITSVFGRDKRIMYRDTNQEEQQHPPRHPPAITRPQQICRRLAGGTALHLNFAELRQPTANHA